LLTGCQRGRSHEVLNIFVVFITSLYRLVYSSAVSLCVYLYVSFGDADCGVLVFYGTPTPTAGLKNPDPRLRLRAQNQTPTPTL